MIQKLTDKPISIAADHRGVGLKVRLTEWLHAMAPVSEALFELHGPLIGPDFLYPKGDLRNRHGWRSQLGVKTKKPCNHRRIRHLFKISETTLVSRKIKDPVLD
jgi:hypothetical protein